MREAFFLTWWKKGDFSRIQEKQVKVQLQKHNSGNQLYLSGVKFSTSE